MGKLMIDPGTAREHVETNYPNDPLLKAIALSLIDQLPKVEAENVVHCQNCRFNSTGSVEGMVWCDRYCAQRPHTGFCNYGRREWEDAAD